MPERRLESIPEIFDSLEVHSRRLYFLPHNNMILHKNSHAGKIKIATTCEALSSPSL